MYSRPVTYQTSPDDGGTDWQFEESLKGLPRKDVNEYLTDKIVAFIRNI